MKFYDCATAPSPRRARMVLAEKGVKPEVVQIDLRSGEQFSDAFRAVNPRCTVPALEVEPGKVLTDNASIVRYLEATQPAPPLLGHDAFDQAMTAEWVSRAEFEGFMAVAEILRNTSKAMKDRALAGPDPVPQIPELAERGRARGTRFFQTLDERFQNSEWLAGPNFSFADISAFVFVEFAAWVKLVPEDSQTALAAWRARMAERPSAAL